jgi:hypothetical protein
MGFMNSYFSPKLAVRANSEKGGYGVFAQAPLAAGEIAMVWGGRVVSLAELDRVPEESRRQLVQIEEDMFSMSVGEPEPSDFINHSCNPNVGVNGNIVLVAMRDIAAGEEVCFDYAMTDGSPYDEFECACGAPNCRGWITGNDWKQPALWERYAGFFSHYLRRRIERLRTGLTDAATLGVQVPEKVFMPAADTRVPRQQPRDQRLDCL